MNNDVFRYILVALVLVVGLLGLAMCADGLCSEDAHVCFRSSERSGPLGGLLQRIVASLTSTMLRPAPAAGVVTTSPRSPAGPGLTLLLLEVSSLRI
jgi:hypothetical protein